jgi:type I restriction enzyme M protein
MRNNMDAAEYKHVVLGLIFLKYISDAFAELYQKLSSTKGADPEDADEYRAENVFYVPKKARWEFLQKNAKQPTIGKLIDDAMDEIEKEFYLPSFFVNLCYRSGRPGKVIGKNCYDLACFRIF